MVKWQFRIERRSTLEPLWCNAIYAWTRFKFRFDPGSKLNVGATRPKSGWRSKTAWPKVALRVLGQSYLCYTVTSPIIPIVPTRRERQQSSHLYNNKHFVVITRPCCDHVTDTLTANSVLSVSKRYFEVLIRLPGQAANRQSSGETKTTYVRNFQL